MEERQEEDYSEQEVIERDEEDAPEQKFTKHFVLPDSKVKLLACERCRLIKSETQWKSTGYCQNCKNHFREFDFKKMTTTKYEGVAALIDMSQSWLRKRMSLGKNVVCGFYAIELRK